MNKRQQMRDLKYNISLLLIILLITIPAFSQSIKKVKNDLSSITTVESAKQFIKDRPDLKCKIYTYNQEKHINELSKKLFELKEQNTLVVEQKHDKALYKIIAIEPIQHYRASYIFFDGKKKNPEEIKFLRKELEIQLRNGKEFKDLAGNHSMDRNASRGGDLGWFTNDYMFPEFIEALDEHDINDVFFLDLEEKKRYYLIKKTEAPKEIKLLTVIKVTI